MKKLLLTLTLLIGLIANAQDYDYIIKLRNVASESEVTNIANEVAALSNIKMRLLSATEVKDRNLFVVRFVPEELTDKEYDAMDIYQQNEFLTISFSHINPGFKFYRITGKYLQVFGFWNKYFRPDASMESLVKDSNLQTLSVPSKNIRSTFYKDIDDTWLLRSK